MKDHSCKCTSVPVYRPVSARFVMSGVCVCVLVKLLQETLSHLPATMTVEKGGKQVRCRIWIGSEMLVSSPVSDELAAAMAATRKGTHLETLKICWPETCWKKQCLKAWGWRMQLKMVLVVVTPLAGVLEDATMAAPLRRYLWQTRHSIKLRRALFCTFQMTKPSFLLKDSSHCILQQGSTRRI